MNNYRHLKKMKVFVVRFPLACLPVAFSIGTFAYLKWDAPASSARTQSSARHSAANAPEADDMPILFTRSNDIWKISLNGLTEQRLTQTTEQENSARWSPDRRKIAYQKVGGGVRQIRTMNPDGSNKTRLTNNGFSDLVAPADYDGDIKEDICVFRPSDGRYLLRSTAGFTGAQFGASGDVPTPNAFVR